MLSVILVQYSFISGRRITEKVFIYQRSFYLEKLLSIYLYTNQALASASPDGDPLAKQSAAESFASLLIFSSKSQKSYDLLVSKLDQYNLLDEMQDRFAMLYNTFEMGYLEAFNYNDGFRKIYARYGVRLI